MKGSLTIHAPQAATLVNLRVLIQPVTVRARRPKRLRVVAVTVAVVPPASVLLRRDLIPGGGAVPVGAGAGPRAGPSDRQLLLLVDPAGDGEVNAGEHREVLIVVTLLEGIGEESPSIGDELEGMVGEGEAALIRVEEEGETAVLLLDKIEVVGAAIDAEDGVPVRVVGVVDALLGGEEDVDDGEDLIGAFEERLGFLSEDGEFA